MLFWILLGLAVWIIGAVVFYILDGWFEYNIDEEGPFFFAAILWPIWIWFVIPGILAGKAHDALKEKKRIYLEKKEALQKIRVEQEKEIETIEEELGKYVEEGRKAS